MKKKLISLFLVLSLLLCGCMELPAPAVPQPSAAPDTTGGEALTVHYIDVGQADCILLECGGEFMLIDGGNREDGQLVVTYLQEQGVEELRYVVCTHAHEDHVGGLPSVLAVYPTDNILAPTRTYSSKVFDDFLYYADQQRQQVQIPSAGDKFTLGNADVAVLGPVDNYAETNDTSIVLMVTFGDTRFLFTGDMETAAENDMVDYWSSDFDWNVDVLKVGHHGSSTSSGYRFVYETDPEYAIISVGEDNSYGHPHEEVVSRYQDAGIPMFRTDELGHIIVTSDGTSVSVTWEDQSAQPADVESAATTYIGNKNSKKLHLPSCTSLPKEENQAIFGSYEEAIEAGYSPCSGCMG